MTQTRPFLIATLVAVVVAFLGGFASQPGDWYDGLNKASLTPPNWAFGPAWTLIYLTCIVSAGLGWRAAESGIQKRWLVILFLTNAALNVVWSVLFFTMQRPDLALFEVAALWGSVAALILFLRSITGIGSSLLLPYLGWVSFAAYLNYQVVALNPAFG